MAKYVFNNASVSIGGTTATQSDIINVTFDWNNKNVESTGMGDTWETFLQTTRNFTGTINGYLQNGDTAPASSLRKLLQDTIADADGQVALIIYPDGVTTGDWTITATVLWEQVHAAVAHADNGLCSLNFKATGTVTEGTKP